MPDHLAALQHIPRAISALVNDPESLAWCQSCGQSRAQLQWAYAAPRVAEISRVVGARRGR
jgi:hypothetical protein